jgi:FkbM family methyltransferase
MLKSEIQPIKKDFEKSFLKKIKHKIGFTSFYLRNFGIVFFVKYVAYKLTGLFPILYFINENIKHPIKLRNCSSDIFVCQQILINRKYDVQDNKLPKVIVDAGANIGCASIWFANKYPNAKVIAIEAQAENFKLLKENVFPYKNIIPIYAALWSKDDISLSIELEYGKGFDGFTVHESNDNTSVKTITIRKIMRDFNLEHIDILKIDIEGAEKEVFEESKEWVYKIGTILVELHDRKKSGCSRAFYAATNDIQFNEWNQGELVCLSRIVK